MIFSALFLIAGIILIVATAITSLANRRELVFASQVLSSVLLGLSVFFITNNAMAFFALASFVFVDLMILSFIGSVELVAEEIAGHKLFHKFYSVALLWLGGLLGALVIYKIFNFNIPDAPKAAQGMTQMAGFFRSLWTDNWLLVALMAILILVNTVGGLLMVRSRS
jgi:NADH:ubiquinone oxidoreductase subunit 6 (subunit J)